MQSLAYKRCPACSTHALDEHRFCPGCGADLAEVQLTAGDPYLGILLADRYEIEALIGEGAMGRVYRARQTAINKPFAIKILHPHLTHDPDSHARFASEAHNAASLNHPNVVSVVDYGRSDTGVTYLAMEHVEGRSLEDIIATEFPLSHVRIIDLTLQILAALTEAHGLNILHRDLKPENILVQSLRTHGELLKVLDFGIAKLMDAADDARPGLTSQGVVCGTPEFMSPEQARGLTLDGRSDLYAVGVILYQMLAGRVPFESDAAVDILHRHIHEAPIPPSEIIRSAPDALEDVCLRALAKDREARFATAAEFRDALVAANEAETSEIGFRCTGCEGPLRRDDRFCAGCGQAVLRPETPPAKRRHTRLSGYSPRVGTGEQTAEVVVRTFPLPLTGRPLLESAQHRLKQPQSGLQTQIIQGAAGMGKTRLLDELAAVAEGSGWQIISSGADPTGAARSLWPIRNVVASLLRLDPQTVTTRDLGRAANVLGLSFEALPGLTELFGLSGPTAEAEHAVRRRECFASAVQTMIASGGSTPLVLIFDDVDRFDAPSRRILQKLTRIDAGRPIFVLVASTEKDLTWLRGPVEVLEALSGEEVYELVHDATVAFNPDSTLPQRLRDAGPACPLHLELLLRVLALGQDVDPHATDDDLLHRRLEILDEIGRRILDVAAILGEQSSDADIRTLVGVEPHAPSAWAVDEGLAALHVLGLLVICGRNERTFSSRACRRIVLADLHPNRRRLLHHEASMRVESILRSGTLRAMHMLRGGGPEFIDVLEDSANTAARSFDDNKSVSLYRAALRACSHSSSQADQDRIPSMVQQMARPLRHSGHAAEAVSMIRDILVSSHPPALEGGLQRALGSALMCCDDAPAAVKAFQRALGPVIACGDPAMILDLYGELAGALQDAGDLDQALKETREGLDMCTLGQGPRAESDIPLWRYLLRMVGLHKRLGDLRAARTWCEHALFQAERATDSLGLLRGHVEMAWLLRDLEQDTLAEQHLARGLEHARHFGDRLTTAEILLERARHRAARGQLEDAHRSLDEALRLAEIIEWPEGMAQAKQGLRTLATTSA